MKKKKRVICAGSGLAALHVALHADKHTEVWILASEGISHSNSIRAKGGIAVPNGDADVKQHIMDTLAAGAGLCDPLAVADIVSSGIRMLHDLERLGFRFDASLAREGGHSSHRVRHVHDETGKYLTAWVASRVKRKPNVRVLYQYALLDLLMENNRCCGVKVGDTRNNTVEWIAADAVVLATGGAGSLYLHHTNSQQSNGEGYAMAARAGALVSGMEFMQFHPTMLYGSKDNMLVTEALRGAGAVLRGADGEELMKDVHPLADLAPRDVVSRTLFQYIKRNKVSHAWLDYRSIDAAVTCREFPAFREMCERHRYREVVPVVPAAHYMCGGVNTGLHGDTGIEGLYAVGEVANTGLHGANRLASNSLLELMVISERIASDLNKKSPAFAEKIVLRKADTSDLCVILDAANMRVRTLLWDHLGIVRNSTGMSKAIDGLAALELELLPLRQGKEVHIGLHRVLNRVRTARLIAAQALARTQSRGCHFIEQEEPMAAGRLSLDERQPVGVC